MKVIHIIPGSGGTFYCENCIRDGALVRALRAAGHDVVMLPMYLPLSTDYPERRGDAPVFYGAVNLYLKQKLPLLRRAPRWCERLLDARGLLDWAARKAGSTRAAGLEEMTLSMLRGEDGQQAGELDRLVAWLRREGQPDIVHLSNALLVGLVRRIKRDLRVPIVCTLQDEDTWLDAMRPPWREQGWRLLAERAAEVDAFVAVSRAYADAVRERLRIPDERLHVVPIGIALDGYPRAPLDCDPPVIGYLARLAEAQGLGLLVEAFAQLKSDPRFRALRLRATGGHTAENKPFLARLRRHLRKRGLDGDVEFLPEFSRRERLAFLRSLAVLSVPVLRGEAFGLYQIEALAAGVPVVQPKLGGFPEIVNDTGGGMVYEPNDAPTLAAALRALLLDPPRLRELGRRGREAVFARYGVETMAARIAEVYGSVEGPQVAG